MKKGLILLLAVMVCATLAFGQETKISKYIWVETDQVNPQAQQAYDNLVKQLRTTMNANNSKFYWVALTPLTGQMNTVTYVTFSDTYAGIEALNKDMEDTFGQMMMKNPGIAKDAAESVRATYSSFSVFRPDLSFRPDMVQMAEATRYRVTQYMVKPGMGTAFEDLVKEVVALEKGVPNAHWMLYQSLSSENGPIYTVVTALKSLADLDDQSGMEAAKSIFTPLVTRDLDRRVAQCVTSTSTSFSAVQPNYSRVMPEVAAANPSFWTVKEQPVVAAATPKAKKGKSAPAAGQ